MSDKLSKASDLPSQIIAIDYAKPDSDETVVMIDGIEFIQRDKAEQQNEALLAQVAELREAYRNLDPDVEGYNDTDGRCYTEESLDALDAVFAKTPQQSLSSIKAAVEEETIERCAAFVAETRHVKMADEMYEKLPRKYQPTE